MFGFKLYLKGDRRIAKLYEIKTKEDLLETVGGIIDIVCKSGGHIKKVKNNKFTLVNKNGIKMFLKVFM